MKRREFLKLVSASVVVAALPVAIVKAVESLGIDPSKIEWVEQTGDFGSSYGIGGRITVNGKEYGQAIHFSVPRKDLMPSDIDKAKEIVIKSLTRTIANANQA